MSVPDLIPVVSPFDDISPSYHPTPWLSAWFAQNYVSDIPQGDVGWMVAQGWAVTAVRSDVSTTPPTFYYTMARNELSNFRVLQSLVNDFNGAYNEGREHNQLRYDDIVDAWTQTVADSTSQLDVQGDHANAFETGYHLYLSSLVSAVDAVIATSLGYVATDAAAAAAQTAVFLAKLADLEANYTAHLAKIEAIITAESDALATYLSDNEAELAKLESEYNAYLSNIRTLETTSSGNATSHIALFQAQLTGLSTDYNSHKTIAEALLINLGTTELARINEHFDNLLAKTRQELTSRGLYSSALVAQSDARVERERTEAIAKLNDQLNREKLENEHKLYDQKVGLRTRTMEGLDRIYQVRTVLQNWKTENEMKLESELATIRMKIAEGFDHRHVAQQDVARNEAGQRDKLLAEKQSATGGTLDAEAKHVSMVLAQSQYKVDARYKLCAQQMEVDGMRLKGMMDTHSEQQGLMAHQLKTRNDLIGNLLNFMERRTDAYPGLENIAQLVTALGDAGSTSVLGT